MEGGDQTDEDLNKEEEKNQEKKAKRNQKTPPKGSFKKQSTKRSS